MSAPGLLHHEQPGVLLALPRVAALLRLVARVVGELITVQAWQVGAAINQSEISINILTYQRPVSQLGEINQS